MSAAELILATGTPPSPPESGRVTLYAAETGELYVVDALGQAHRLLTSAGAVAIAAGATLTVPVSGTASVYTGTPTAGRVAQWQSATHLSDSPIRISSSGAVGIGKEPTAPAGAGNLDLHGSLAVNGSVRAASLTAYDTNAASQTLKFFASASTSTVYDVLQATLDSSSDALLVRMTLLLASTNNTWATYIGHATGWYASGVAYFSTSLQPEKVQGTPQAPLLAWSGTGDTRTLTVQNMQPYSLLVVQLQVAARTVTYSLLIS
ncbi:MAG: hypothetical protein HC911_14820 [Chloroflexaceae bacterium]|nr:hypothetical protein [Chloroflexaceae bacterium]